MRKLIILCVAIAVILIGACSPVRPTYDCLSSVHMPKSNLDFQLLWSRTGIAVYPGRFSPLMQGVASKVFVVTGKDFEYGGSKILALETQSGKVLWQRDITLPSDIITSNNQLYIGLYDKIEKVDSQTGKLVQTVEISQVGFIYNIFATEHNLYAFTKSGRWLIYNIDDGTYGLSEPFLPYTPFLIENGIIYFSEGGVYKAKETKTQSILWEHSLNQSVHVHPLFTDSVIILSTLTGNIYALDKNTGNLLWQTEANVISNIAADKSQLYFLTSDGYLKVLDQKDGLEIQQLEFDPAVFESKNLSSDDMIGAYNLWVDAENNVIIVSFGDTCQMMALKYSVPK